MLLSRLCAADGLGLHLGAGLTAGLVATLLGSPADVIGTRVIAEAGQARGVFAVAADVSRGPFAVAADVEKRNVSLCQ